MVFLPFLKRAGRFALNGGAARDTGHRPCSALLGASIHPAPFRSGRREHTKREPYAA